MAVLEFEKNAMMWEQGTWILYIATDYDGTIYPDGDGTNESTSIADIESKFTFADVWYFENFAPYINNGDEKVITTDYSYVLEIIRKSEMVYWFTVDVQEILEMNNLALILWAKLETKPATWTEKGTETIWLKRKWWWKPYQLFKFVSTPNAEWLSNVFYFVKAVMVSDMSMPYINLENEDFAWVSLDFEVGKGWNFFLQKQVKAANPNP